MNVGLYIFDRKKDELRFEVVHMDEIELLCTRPTNIYVTDSNLKRYRVSAKQGKVKFDHLWLYQRNDEKAKELFKEYFIKKRKEHDNQVVKMWRRINLLDSDKIQVTSVV